MNQVTLDEALQLGLKHHSAGELKQAESVYGQILQTQPNHPDALHLLGVIAYQQGRAEAAMELINRAIAIRPAAPFYLSLGNALRSVNRPADAIAAYRRSITVQPDLSEAWINLGLALVPQGDDAEIIAAFTQAIRLQPNCGIAYFNRGAAYRRLGQLPSAIEDYRRAITINPDDAPAYDNLAEALRRSGQLDECLEVLQKALPLNPGSVHILNNMSEIYSHQGRLDELLQCLKTASRIDPLHVTTADNFAYMIHFHPDYGPRQILEENLRWASIFEKPLLSEIRPHLNDLNPLRRLRIGYVAADFCMSAIACFLLPLLTHHDAREVEVYCYASVRKPDAFTTKFRQLNLVWRDCVNFSDAQLAQVIRGDGIDILIDLTLHMSGNRLLTFARKPAPVQVSWLGCPSTTGLAAINYRLSDPHIEPPDIGDQFYCEKTIRLAHSYWCYQPLAEDSPDVNPLPALKTGHLTFCCFNNPCKISLPAIELWIELLQSLPGSRLFLFSHPGSHRRRFVQRFVDAGIDASRIEFCGVVSIRDYFGQHHSVDIALDPFPYNGGTTTCDAFWMGVPTITLAGQSCVGRMGVSLLTSTGLKDWIARDPQEYLSIARRWADNPGELAKIRAALRDRLRTSVLMDGRQFAADIESAYRAMWRTHCQKGGPS